MNNIEFVNKLKNIANNYKTLYVMGCFGAPMTDANKERYIEHHEYNQDPTRAAMIRAASADTFGFDCVCLIKGVLWGWYGDLNRVYGGAGYAINGVPDIGANTMIKKCSGLSTNFNYIEIGEAVWMEGHIGVYIGDGLAVECSPKWANGVQITACNCTKAGYNRRNWTKHGKLPYITYDGVSTGGGTGTGGTTTNIKPTGSSSIVIPTLRKGNIHDSVKTLQILLIGYGYEMTYNGKTYGADGEFGAATEKAVKAYQSANGLANDGVVGKATWSKLLGV